jgi:chemotaxis-related protein WspB
VPAIDLSELTTGQPARECLSTRIILVQQTDPAGRSQLIGLIAERATELLRRESKDLVKPSDTGHVPSDMKETPPLMSPATRHLSPALSPFGPVLMDAKGLVQLIHPQRLLPGELRSALFEQVAELVDEGN